VTIGMMIKILYLYGANIRLNNMNQQINAGYGTQHERMGKVSIEPPFAIPKSGTFDMIKYNKGDVINGLEFIKEIPRKQKHVRRALFKCYCGREFESGINWVRAKTTTSCGCSRSRHKLSESNIYRRWADIKSRCSNPTDSSYKWYGAKGIKICDEWLNDFKAFYDHVTSLSGYNKSGLTLDRINSIKNYEPGNLQWANRHRQMANRNIPSHNSTGYVGVGKERHGYYSRIIIMKKSIYIGWYSNIKDAVNARNNYIIDNNLTEYPIQIYHG